MKPDTFSGQISDRRKL